MIFMPFGVFPIWKPEIPNGHPQVANVAINQGKNLG